MKRLTFQGYSDDTFACEGPGIDVDLDIGWSSKPVMMVVASGTDSMLVVGQYAPGPCHGWLIGVAPYSQDSSEEQHIPEWPIRFERSDREYSPMLVIEAPDDVKVELLS